jgi:hypothetical protein
LRMSAKIEELRAKDNMGNVLDPLLKIIATEYIDDRDLSQFLRRMFVSFADLSQVFALHDEAKPIMIDLFFRSLLTLLHTSSAAYRYPMSLFAIY